MSQSGLLKMWARCVVPGVMAVGTLSTLALSGCDTVARLSFSDRVFNDVRLVGFTSEAGSCKGSNGDAVMRFVLADGDGNPIDNETVIGNSAVSLSQSDVSVDNVTLFQVPDVNCGLSSVSCESGFACAEDNAIGQSCQLPGESIGVAGAPSMISQITTQQAFAVLVENSASIHGRLPRAIDSPVAPDYTGGMDGGPDGKADSVGSEYSLANPARATDGGDTRLTAVSNIAQTWEVVFRRAATDNSVRSGLGVWTFGEQDSELISAVPGGTWAYSDTAARETARRLNSNDFMGTRSTSSAAAVYESIISVIEDEDGFGQFAAGDEKILTVIVDGPDDLRLPAVDAQAVIEAATAAGVRIFFVHLDPEVQVRTMSGVPLIPDSTRYVQQQDSPCDASDENACKGFEACRVVTAFAGNEGGNVMFPAGKIGETYCAIDYNFTDEEQTRGRIGPIDEYAEIACATGGGYLYYPSRDKLSDGNGTIAKLPLALDSLWEVPVEVSAFDRQVVEPGEAYKTGLNFSVTVNGTQKRQSLTEDFISVRPVLFSAEQ